MDHSKTYAMFLNIWIYCDVSCVIITRHRQCRVWKKIGRAQFNGAVLCCHVCEEKLYSFLTFRQFLEFFFVDLVRSENWSFWERGEFLLLVYGFQISYAIKIRIKRQNNKSLIIIITGTALFLWRNMTQ